MGGYEATKGSWPWQVRKKGRLVREGGKEDGEVVTEEKAETKKKFPGFLRGYEMEVVMSGEER